MGNIFNLNGLIRRLNTESGRASPQLNPDLSKNPKVKKRGSDIARTKNRYNLNLLKDGVHSDTILSRVWLRKLRQQAKADCWSAGTAE